MISKTILRRFLALFICSTLLGLGLPVQPASAGQDPDQSAQPSSTAATPSAPAPTAAPLTSDQLDALVAPIALYPDALVAQVLGAATYPDQVAIADYWVSQNKTLTP